MGTGDLSYPEHRLATLLREAADGRFPPDDGVTEVVAAPAPGGGACVAFTAHSVVALDLDPDEVRARLAEHRDPLAAALAPDVVVWLAERAGLRAGIIDAVLAATGTGTGTPGGWVEAEVDHPRVHRALARREDVRVFSADGDDVVTIGRGLVGRWELALECEVHGQRRGRALITDALGVVPQGEPVFAQVSPGNARSLRAFLAAGFRPLGSEVLFHP